MSMNKLLPATLVLLALAGSTAMAACSASAESALDGTIVDLSSTTLTSAIIPVTTSTKTFKSDPDGHNFPATTSTLISAANSGESCNFGVTCPTGYFVYLNVSGRLVSSTATGTDRISATGGGKSYVYSQTSGYSHTQGLNYESVTPLSPQGIVTTANTLTWDMTSHYDVYGYGYEVVAGCTNFVVGTCPITGSATHFASLATASPGTSVTLDIEQASPVDGDNTPTSTFPVGVNCSWPVTCPIGTEVVFTWTTGIDGNNPHSPVITIANGTRASDNSHTGHSVVNINWAITNWNVSETKGFALSALCETMPTTTAAPTTVAASTTTAAASTTAAATTSGSPVTNTFSTSASAGGSGASVVSFAAAVVAAIVVALV